MARVFVGIGSNINRYTHVVAALDALSQQFGELALSPIYESEAVGFKGSRFLNMVAAFDTVMQIPELVAWLKQVEAANGRKHGEKKFASRTLDIDILLYGSQVGLIDGIELPRDEILHNAFVLKPLADLEPELKHPVQQVSYSALWDAYDKDQALWPVDFVWRGQKVSRAD